MNKAKTHKKINHNWRTPNNIFNPLHKIFRFDLDLMATEQDAKTPKFISNLKKVNPKDLSGMALWVNPPYGNNLYWAMPIIWEISHYADYVVCLLPASFDLAWYHEQVLNKAYQFVRRKRIKFNPPTGVTLERNSPSHANLLAIYTGPGANDFSFLRRMIAQTTEWKELRPPNRLRL